MTKGVPLTKEEQERRRKEIYEASVNLFLERGFHETSMREIARVTGVGKSTLYDYFQSKEEILIAFIVDDVQHVTVQVEAIVAQELSASEKLHRIMRIQLDNLVANKHLYLKLSSEAQRLSLESQQRIWEERHAYQDMLCDLVREGIQKGEFRQVNPLLVVRGMSSFLTSAVYTSRPTGSPEEMMAEAMDFIFRGLVA